MTRPLRVARFLPIVALLLAPALAFADDENENENDGEEGDQNETEQFDACDVCHSLDDIEETCEAQFGDGATPCEDIGTLEEACPQGDGDQENDGEENDPAAGDDDRGARGDDTADSGDEAGDEGDNEDGGECPDLCAQIPALLDTCTAALGADHQVCADLNELITVDCVGSSSANTEGLRGRGIATCDAGLAAASGGVMSILLAGFAFGRRRPQR